jgi:hypothetical protein
MITLKGLSIGTEDSPGRPQEKASPTRADRLEFFPRRGALFENLFCSAALDALRTDESLSGLAVDLDTDLLQVRQPTPV